MPWTAAPNSAARSTPGRSPLRRPDVEPEPRQQTGEGRGREARRQQALAVVDEVSQRLHERRVRDVLGAAAAAVQDEAAGAVDLAARLRDQA